MVTVLAALVGCGAEPAAPTAPAASAAPAPQGLAPAALVTLELHAVEGEERRLVELRGLVASQLEAGLADLKGVVPLVENVPISPGLAGRLESEAERWRLAVRVDQPDRETAVISVELCEELARPVGSSTRAAAAPLHGVGSATAAAATAPDEDEDEEATVGPDGLERALEEADLEHQIEVLDAAVTSTAAADAGAAGRDAGEGPTSSAGGASPSGARSAERSPPAVGAAGGGSPPPGAAGVSPAAAGAASAGAARPPPPRSCTTFAETAGDDPTPATAALLEKLSEALGRGQPPAAQLELWERTPSKDRYARLIAGRSSATWYRLLPPVSAEHLHDRRFDPVERAIFIDPRMAVAHWMAGRRRFEARDWSGARSAFSRAGLAAPERLVHLAEEAAALEALGQLEAARTTWDTVVAKAPGDVRFVLPRTRVLLAMEATREAVAELDALGPRFQGDPRVLALRVTIAERAGGRPEDQLLLERWQLADPTSPEPVRRRIALFVQKPALAEAYALLPELARRGAAEEAAELRLALATSLGRLDEARVAAEALGQSATAAALALRAGLERGDPPAALEALAQDPMGRVAVAERFLASGDAAHALRVADAVLVTEAWMPEALVLRARALTALGRDADAAESQARAEAADPGWARTSTAPR